jgi:hypothetical protein
MRELWAGPAAPASGRNANVHEFPAILGARMLRDVCVLAFDQAPVFEIGVLCEVFGLDRSADGLPRFDFALCAGEPAPLRTSSGFLLDTPHGLERLRSADLVAVPGWRSAAETPPRWPPATPPSS